MSSWHPSGLLVLEIIVGFGMGRVTGCLKQVEERDLSMVGEEMFLPLLGFDRGEVILILAIIGSHLMIPNETSTRM
jgi:hypothetical protein